MTQEIIMFFPFVFLSSQLLNKQGACQTMAFLPFTLQSILKAKEELWKLKYFTMQKYINLQKNPLKETKILQDIIITL